MFRFSLLSSPLGLFLTGIGISLAGMLLFVVVLQFSNAGGLAYLLLVLLIVIVILTILLLSIHIATINSAEQSIQEQSSELSSIISSIGEGLLVIDTNKTITMMNPVALNLGGFAAIPHHAPLETTFAFFQNNTPLAVGSWPILEALRAKKTVKTALGDDITMKGSHQLFPVVGSASPLMSSDGELFGAVFVFRDATGEKRIDENKTEFVSLASHQLKTPLTIINWYCELLLSKKNVSLHKELRDYIKHIATGGRRMVSLVNELLIVTQIEEGRMHPRLTPADLSSAVCSVLDECDPLIKQRHGTILFTKPAKPLRVSLDHVLFSQALLNIIINAVEYAKGGACHIEISAHCPSKGMCVLTIRDEGIGIPNEDKEHVFEKFYRAKNAIDAKTEGSGLGLYIAKRFLELMKSDLTFESEERQGTTFTIRLPIA